MPSNLKVLIATVLSLVAGSAEAGSPAKPPLVAVLKVHVVQEKGTPARLLADVTIRSRASRPIRIGTWKVFSGCRLLGRNIEVTNAEGFHVPYQGRMEEQQGDHEVIPAGGYFRIKGLDLTNQYRFPAGRNLLRFFYTASVVDGDLIFDFVSARISLRYQAPPPGDPRQEPPRKPERRETPQGTTVTCVPPG